MTLRNIVPGDWRITFSIFVCVVLNPIFTTRRIGPIHRTLMETYIIGTITISNDLKRTIIPISHDVQRRAVSPRQLSFLSDIVSIDYVRGEVGEMVAEVLYGAVREDERVVEGGVSEALWRSRHDVLVRAVTKVTVAVVMRSKTTCAHNKHAQHAEFLRFY